ncbi:MAG: GAF domain-containing protein [Fimbriimonadaceae bacterium]|nr:GAF domain-containing protein [Fimbriimonadaceae bacterium]QYK58220.1 MAG: GAF domain-containing protein [Fimbriimonadaceae bacterium]
MESRATKIVETVPMTPVSGTPTPEDLVQRIAELEAENQRLRSGEAGRADAGSARPVPMESSVDVAPIQEGDVTLRRLVQRIAMILQAEKIVIMFYDRESGELRGIPPAYGVDDTKLDHFRVRATQGVSGEVFRGGEPVIFHNAAVDDRTRKDMVSLMHVHNGITVPLIIEKRDEENRVTERTTIGVLHAFNKRHGEDFNDEDVRLLERMARNVSSIIANLQLYREVVEEREELLQTFESLTSGLILVSPDKKISQMNATARSIFGVEVDIVGQRYDEKLDAPKVVSFFDRGLMGADIPPIEIEVERNSQERVYTVQGAAVKNEDGKTLGFVTIFNDITDQKNLDKMKSSFVAMASHELRTPLTAIKGFSTTLLEGVDGDFYSKDDQKEFLGIVVHECDRLRRLIDDLLNTARIEAGQSLKPNYTRFSLEDLLDKVVMVQNQASTRHKVFKKVQGDLPASLIGDEDKFDQILTNLLNNAIKYSPEGGDVLVHARVDGNEIELGVEDQGIGIPAEHLGKVFEKFHRVNNEDNRKIYGTGLGLFLVKHLVEDVHLGKIWVESEVGKGSTFKFRVPIELDIEEAKRRNDEMDS